MCFNIGFFTINFKFDLNLKSQCHAHKILVTTAIYNYKYVIVKYYNDKKIFHNLT